MNWFNNDKEKLGTPTANGKIYKQVNTVYRTEFSQKLYWGSMMNILLDTFAKVFTNVKGVIISI